MQKIKLVLIALLLGSLLAPAYFYFLQRQENSAIEEYLSVHAFNNLPLTRESAFAISDQVRRDFITDKKSFKHYDMEDRPFLRDEVKLLLETKEGLCGEGTRVIVALLQNLGFDATRISLYDEELTPKHTLISVELDGREFLVDSINSKPELTRFLDNNDVSTQSFNIKSYSQRFDGDSHRKDQQAIDKANPLSPYWLYSYEALPVSKILAKIGFDMRVFNLQRPPAWVSLLAESPNMIMFYASLAVSLGLLIPLLLVFIWGRKRFSLH